jgi:hypothetical protein
MRVSYSMALRQFKEVTTNTGKSTMLYAWTDRHRLTMTAAPVMVIFSPVHGKSSFS